MSADAPLTDEELVELDDFLLSDACSDETLSIDEAHGFLTALVMVPEPTPQATWLDAIWGEPQFADAAQEQRMTELLLRLHDEIADALREGGPFEPLVAEEEEDGELYETYEGWCFGFMLGVELHQELWEQLPKNEQQLLAPMAKLALLNADEEAEMDEAECESWLELLPGAVAGLYTYWRRTN